MKGVSKTIIEVNNTGSKLFEKIVFYVTPEYGNLNAKQLKRAASNFSFNFDDSLQNSPLRKRIKNRKLKKIVVIGGCILTALICILLFVL